MNNVETITVLGTLLSRKYGKDLFKLLKIYNDISASEASSRLGLHVQTVQEFLESTEKIGLTVKTEVIEKKRPYYRYSLVKETLTLQFNIVDLTNLINLEAKTQGTWFIKELKNSKSHFNQARNGNYFSAVFVTTGKGRDRSQKKINLTIAQGKFLYHLPFPDASPLPISTIIKKADISSDHEGEIMDIVTELIEANVIEKCS